MRALRLLPLLFLATSACGPTTSPPDDYPRYFVADTVITIIYDDLGVPPSMFTELYDISIVSGDTDGSYLVTLGFCEFSLTQGGVTPDGIVQLGSGLDDPCSYTTTSGATFDIDWTMTDIDWSADRFDAYLDGTFVSRMAGRDDRTGTYTVLMRGH